MEREKEERERRKMREREREKARARASKHLLLLQKEEEMRGRFLSARIALVVADIAVRVARMMNRFNLKLRLFGLFFHSKLV
jgi:hypothetical protein